MRSFGGKFGIFFTVFLCLVEITRHDTAGLESLEGEAGGLREQIKYFDIYRERPVRLTVRALVPTKEHPKVESALKALKAPKTPLKNAPKIT